MIDIFFTIIMIEMEPLTKIIQKEGYKIKLVDALHEPIEGVTCFDASEHPMLDPRITYMGFPFKVKYNGRDDIPIIIVNDGIFFRGKGGIFGLSDKDKFLPKCDIQSITITSNTPNIPDTPNNLIVIIPKHGQEGKEKKKYIFESSDIPSIKKALGTLGFKVNETRVLSDPYAANAPRRGGRRKTKRAKKNKRRTRRS